MISGGERITFDAMSSAIPSQRTCVAHKIRTHEPEAVDLTLSLLSGEGHQLLERGGNRLVLVGSLEE